MKNPISLLTKKSNTTKAPDLKKVEKKFRAMERRINRQISSLGKDVENIRLRTANSFLRFENKMLRSTVQAGR